MKIDSILKHFSFYGEYKKPILSIVRGEIEEYSYVFDPFFEDIYFCKEDEIDYSKKYSSIIFTEIDSIPLRIQEILNVDGSIYVFSTKNIVENILLDQFSYVKKDIFEPVLRILNNEFVNFMKFDYPSKELFLFRASNSEVKEAKYNFEISLDLLEDMIEKIYQYKDVNSCANLYYKQEILKDFFKKLSKKNEKLLKLNHEVKLNSKIDRNEKEISYIIKLINLIKEDINSELDRDDLFDIDKHLELKTIELENKINLKDKKINELNLKNLNLIKESNENVSRLSHLEFDFNDLLEEKNSLEESILELEKLLENSENTMIDKIKKISKEKNNLEYENLRLKKDLSILVKEFKKIKSSFVKN